MKAGKPSPKKQKDPESGLKPRLSEGPVNRDTEPVEDSRQIEEELREREARYRAVIETSADGFLITSAEGRILEVNDIYVKRSGYSREELLGMYLTELDAKETPEETASHIETIIRDGSDIFETLHRAKDGTVWPVEINTTFWPIDKGIFFAFIRDLLHRRRSEALLAARFRLSELAEHATLDDLMQATIDEAEIFTGSRIGFFHFVEEDQDTISLQTWSTNTLATMCSAEGKGKHYPISEAGVWVDCFHQRAPVIHQDYASLSHKKGLPEGHARVVRELALPIIRSGKVKAIIGVGNKTSAYTREDVDAVNVLASLAIDLVERKKAEEALRQSEKELKEAQQIARLGSWKYNPGSEELRWSEELYRIFSMDPADGPLTLERFLDRVHPDDRAEVRKQNESGLPYRSDYRILLPENRIKFIHEEVEIHRDDEGHAIKYVGIAQDITERKRAEEELRQKEEFIRAIHDAVGEGFIVVDRDYKVVSANRAFCEQTGLPLDNIIGRNCFRITHKTTVPCHETEEYCPVKRVFISGVPETMVHRHLDEDDNEYFVEAKAYPLKDASGKVTAAVEVLHDVTERHLLEAERLKSQKLEAIGSLAGGIAHDFNNLLQGMFGYLSMARHFLEKPEKASEMLEQAEKALAMSVHLTTQLLTFAKGGKPVIEPTDLGPVIENVSNFALSGSRCESLIQVPDDLWQAEVDAGQISQVLQNIVLNACEATPEGGCIDIVVENLRLAKAESVHFPEGGDFIGIKIKDKGIGIPEENRTRIFDPYFTTKQQGSGLGLATSYSIIKQHGGAIEVQPNEKQGTIFTVYLPAMAQRSEKKRPATATAAGKRGRILIMDDEELVLNVARNMFEALGHDVSCTTNGEKAIEEYRQALAAGAPFDVVILDLTIRGGMGGEEVVKRLLEVDPKVKAVVSSGYSDSPVVSDYREHGFAAVLSKPYTLGSLKDCLRELLAE